MTRAPLPNPALAQNELLHHLAAVPDRSQVATELARLQNAIAEPEPLTTFLATYLRTSGQRVATNLCRLQHAARLGASMLDIGSLGVEPTLVRHAHPTTTIAAVSYEGDQLFYEGTRLTRTPSAATPTVTQRLEQCDVETQPLPYAAASFDLVTCFETLEHLHRTPLSLFDEARRVLKPNGVLWLTTPNVVGTRAVARALLGRHPQENPRYHREARYGVVHPKEYAPYELQDLCRSRGFAVQVLRTEYYRSVGFGERLFGVALRGLRALFGSRFRPSGHGDNCFLLATPAPTAIVLPQTIFE